MPPKKKNRKKHRFPTLAVLFGVFLIMLGTFFLLTRGDAEQDRETNKPFFQNFDSKNVSRLEIQGPKSETVTLAKIEEQWLVENKGNYAADDSFISGAFTLLSSLRSGTLVSKNPEKQEEMGVSDTSGLHVTFLKKDGAPVLDFFLGNRGPVLESQYVRIAGSDEVYLFSENLDFYFDKAEWRDKSILGLSSDDIAEFAIKSPSGKSTYALSESQWKVKKDDGTLEAVPDPEKVNSLALDIAGLSGLSFVENEKAKAIDFENRADAVKLWVQTRQDATYTVYFVKENETVYAKRVDGGTVFTVAEVVYSELTAL